MEVKWCMQDHLEQIRPYLVLVEVDQPCWHSTSKAVTCIRIRKSSRDSYMRRDATASPASSEGMVNNRLHISWPMGTSHISNKTVQTSLNALNSQLASDGVEAKITNLVNLLMRRRCFWALECFLRIAIGHEEFNADSKGSHVLWNPGRYRTTPAPSPGRLGRRSTWKTKGPCHIYYLVSDLLIFAHPTGPPLARCYVNFFFQIIQVT